MFAVLGIEFEDLGVEQIGERDDGFLTAGRALIDRRFAAGNGLGIGPATRIGALPALGLRQQRIDLIDHRITLDFEANRGITENQAE